MSDKSIQYEINEAGILIITLDVKGENMNVLRLGLIE